MPSAPVGFTEAVFRFQRIGAPRIATWTLGVDDNANPPASPTLTAGDLWTIFSNASGPYAAGVMTGSWQFVGVTCTFMTEEGPLVGEFNSTITGAAAGAPLVPNCALLIKKATSGGGRRNRGRMYVPPVWPPETKVDANGVIDSGEVAVLQNQYDFAYTAMTGGNLLPVLFHSEAPFTPTAIDGFVVQSLMATQRRRLRK